MLLTGCICLSLFGGMSVQAEESGGASSGGGEIASVSEMPPKSTNFTKGELDGWKIENENKAGYSVEPGVGLRLPTQDNDIYEGGTGWENIFLQPAAGDWDIVSKVYYPVAPSENYQQQAFLVWQDEDNYIKVDAEYHYTGSVAAQMCVEIDGAVSSIGSAQSLNAEQGQPLTVYYRYKKAGNDYTGYYSLDGENFIELGTTTAAFNNVHIGVMATKNSTNAVIDTYCQSIKVLSQSTDFTKGKFDGWKIENEDETDYSVVPGEGLRLPTQDNDIYAEGTGWKNAFLQPVAGDWDVVSKVYYPIGLTASFQQQALLAWQDEDNYIKVDIEYSWDGNVKTNMCAEIAGAAAGVGEQTPQSVEQGQPLTIYYRIAKVGNDYTGYYSFDGENYVTIGTTTAELNDVHIGLFATMNRDENNTNAAIDTYCQSVEVTYLETPDEEDPGEEDPVEKDYEITTTFTPDQLSGGMLVNANVDVENINGESKPVVAIVALYDANNKMVNVSFISKTIEKGTTDKLNAGFKLPADITGHEVRVMVWDGTGIGGDESNMEPLSNVVTLAAQ